MKKISKERDFYRNQAGQARWRNELRRQPLIYRLNKAGSPARKGGRDLIIAPSHISIYDLKSEQAMYGDTILFLEDIKKRFMRNNCYIDFSKTEYVSAAALVVVYAAIDDARNGRSGKAEIIWSKTPRINGILRANNFHKLIRGYEISYSLSSGKAMPIVSSVGSELMEDIIDFIQKRIYKDMTPDMEHIYGDAVSETINNVRLHAYPDSVGEEKRWWLMCSVIGKKLYLAIYDNGVGIPRTVVDRPWFWPVLQITYPSEYSDIVGSVPGKERSLLLRLLPTKIPDGELIYLSMQGDVSGTKQEKHGQGSKSIMALVNDTSDGVLWVFSNGGLYKFDQSDKKPEVHKLIRSFPGTLVQWNIELP